MDEYGRFPYFQEPSTRRPSSCSQAETLEQTMRVIWDKSPRSQSETVEQRRMKLEKTRELFSEEQIELVSESLISAAQCDRLARFLWAVSVDKNVTDSEPVQVGKAYIYFWRHDFPNLYRVLQGM